jgi:hypothetical protein
MTLMAHSSDVGLAISLGRYNFKIAKFLSPQITIASSSDKYSLFSRLCKHHLKKP